MPNEFPERVRGNIALIQRGATFFAEKVFNAMNAGALGVIIFNNEPGEFSGTLFAETTVDGRTWIPVVTVSGSTGATLRNQVGTSAVNSVTGTIINKRSNWNIYSGTSMATPHVTGVIALIWSVNPNFTNSTVEGILFSTCTDLGPKDYDPNFGHGLVNASAAVAKAEASR
jgi:subtilisin family serine protease